MNLKKAALRIVYQDQIFATDIYKILNVLSPDIIKDISKTKVNYNNTVNALILLSRNIETIRYRL